MAASPVPAAQQRLFHLSVSIDSELLQHQPGLADAVRDRLMAQVEPACTVEVTPGDFVGFTVEASSHEDVEELGPRGARTLVAGLQWVEDQATAILDRIFYPSSHTVVSPLRASLALVLAKTGRAALGLLLLVFAAGAAQAATLADQAQAEAVRLALVCECAVVAGEPVVQEVSIAKPMAIYVGSFTADWVSTAYAVSQGAEESNPLLKGSDARRGMLLVAAAGALTAIDVQLQKRDGRGWARGLRIATLATRAIAVVSNIHQGRSAR